MQEKTTHICTNVVVEPVLESYMAEIFNSVVQLPGQKALVFIIMSGHMMKPITLMVIPVLHI